MTAFKKFDPHAFLERERVPQGRSAVDDPTVEHGLDQPRKNRSSTPTPAKPAKVAKAPSTLATLATLAVGEPEPEIQENSAVLSTWTEGDEEQAAIIQYDAVIPRSWAEALARLDPGRPPGEVQAKRWVQFIDDCGRFLDSGWASRVETLGWGPLDLFGCDRERPLARVEHLGLLWLVKGGLIIDLHRDQAILQTKSGARQTYRRRPVEVGRVVLAWELDA
jgi:hypothetical protein